MGAALHVTVIDDDMSVGTAIGALLTSLGYQTEVYVSADEFIERVAQSEAACLVVDVQLGKQTGIELGHHLTSLGYTFPIIFITGSDSLSLQKQATAFGCVAYLRKPIEPARLSRAIAEAVGQPQRPFLGFGGRNAIG
jgi:FixJ family two-component response regulator